jgi:hypothetical protein
LPFEEPVDNYLELFNESCILLVLTCLMAFAPGSENVFATFNFGYLIMSLILFNIAVNIVMFIIPNAILIYRKVIRPLGLKCARLRGGDSAKKEQASE